MKCRIIFIFLGSIMLFTSQKIQAPIAPCHIIDTPPASVSTTHEIALVYPQRLASLYQKLTPQERIFCYYLYRASLPGYRVAADQNHRYAVQIEKMLEFIVVHHDQLHLKSDSAFFADVKTYLIYLWTNHGQYFMREHANQKRTPERLGLTHLNQEALCKVLKRLNYPNAQNAVDEIAESMFDTSYEPTLTAPDSIEKSAVNMYSVDFRDGDFAQLSPGEQHQLNSYCFIDYHNGVRTPKILAYKINGKYDKELTVSFYWLQKALHHARKYPNQFDKHLVKSLDYLCQFIKTGDEELFKKHSIEWLQSNSRLDYCWGFIETYEDPKGYRGSFQAEVTVKSLDINSLNKILPSIEASLPFPPEFKRDNLLSGTATLPNASINTKIFAVGNLGPLNITAAYCLPNYQEIRSAHGSKQIIYHQEKGIGELLNADLYHRLFHLPDEYEWLRVNDPEFALDRDIFNIECILHETLGHGSGKFATHVFKDGDLMKIDGKAFSVGDKIPVTSGNIEQFLAGYAATLEELRAEIIALLAAITNYDVLATSGIMGDWPKKVLKPQMIELMINAMAQRGLGRLILQQDNATEIAGDHARANTTIMNFLVEQGGVKFKEVQIKYHGKTYNVVGTQVVNLNKAIESVKELAIRVQRIHSTGDTQDVRVLIDTYGKPILHPDHLRIMKQNMRACVGDVKVSGSLYPDFEPVYDQLGEIVDVVATWPRDIVEQFMGYREIMLSKE